MYDNSKFDIDVLYDNSEGGSPTNSNRYCLSVEEHYEAYKEMFGAENVEWTSCITVIN